MQKNKERTVFSAQVIKFVFLVVWGIFIGAALAFYDLGAISLFIDTFGAAGLPKAFLLSGLLGMIILSIYAFQRNRYAYTMVALVCYSVISFGYFVIYYGMDHFNKPKYIYFAFVFAIPAHLLIIGNFQRMHNFLFGNQEVRKLGQWSNIGIVLSSITVFYCAHLLQVNLNLRVAQFILLGGAFLTIATVLLLVATTNIQVLKELTVSAQYINAKNNYSKLYNNRYVRLLLLFSVSIVIPLLFIDFYFFRAVEQNYEGLNALVNFLAQFWGISLTVGLFVHFVIYNFILNKYGLKVALLVLPVAIVLLSGLCIWIGSYFGHTPGTTTFYIFFIVVCSIQLISSRLKENLMLPALRYYFLPIPEMLRHDTIIKVIGVGQQLATALGAVLLLLFTTVIPWNPLYYAILLIVMAVTCTIIVFKIYAAYREVLKETLDKQQIVKADQARLSYVGMLADSAKLIATAKLPPHLNIINLLDPVIYKSAVLSLIDHENDAAQAIALKQANKLCLLEAIPVLKGIMLLKYFNVLKNRDLILDTYDKLRGAEFRLEKLRYIEQLTYSKLINERVFGASLTRYADEDIKPKLLNKLFRDPISRVRYYAAAAAAGSNDEGMLKNLTEMLADSRYSNAAVAAISNTGVAVLPVLESAFNQTGQLEKIQLRIIQIFGSVGTKEAVELLLKKLDLPNQNIISGALVALSRSGYNVKQDKALSIKRELEEVCSTVVWNMSAFLDLKRTNTNSLLIAAMKAEITNNYQTIFQLLALLYEPKSVELVEKNINSGNTDQSDFASELLDILVEEELKSYLLPVLNVSSYSDKVKKLQYVMPTTPMKKKEVLYNLIQRDYKKTNRWTKACAISDLKSFNAQEDHEIFAANLVNPDIMLREIAARAYHGLSQNSFDEFMERDKYQKEYAEQALKLIEMEQGKGIEHLRDSPRINIDIVKFLTEIEPLKAIPGLVLSEISKLTTVKYIPKESTIGHFSLTEEMNFGFIYKGSVRLEKEGEWVADFSENSFMQNYDLINTVEGNYQLVAVEDCIIYTIKRADFNELCSFHNAIPKALLLSKTAQMPVKSNRMSRTLEEV